MKMTLSLLMLCGALLFPQKKLTANDAVKIALTNNTTIQRSGEELRSASTALKSSYGAFFPTVSASAGWDWRKRTISSPVSVTTDSRNYSVGISSNVTLYDGLANFKNYEHTERGIEIAKNSLERLKQDIIFQTLSLFYDIINAKKLLEVREEDVKWNKKNYEIISERNRLGAVTLADVYASQVKLGNAELEVVRARTSLETLKTNFLYSLGIDVLEQYEFEEPAQSVLESPQVLDDPAVVKSLVDHALKNRPDVAASTLSIQNAQLEMQIAETGHYPRVSNYLTLGAENSTPGTMFDNRSYSFGFSLDVPIFSGWNVETKTEIAAIEAKIRTIQHDDLKRDISRAVSKAFLDLQSAAKQLEVNKKNVTAATENRRIEEEKYALGSTSLLNVLIANSDYTGAVSNLINTQYQFRKVNDQLLYLTGALHAK